MNKPMNTALVVGGVAAAALTAVGVAYAVSSAAASNPNGALPSNRGIGNDDIIGSAFVDEQGRLVYKLTKKRLPFFNRGSALDGKQFVGKEELPDGLIVYRAWDPNTRQLEQIEIPSSAMLARQRQAYLEEKRAEQAQADAERRSGRGKKVLRTLGIIGEGVANWLTAGGYKQAKASFQSLKKSDDESGSTSADDGLEIVPSEADAAEQSLRNEGLHGAADTVDDVEHTGAALADTSADSTTT